MRVNQNKLFLNLNYTKKENEFLKPEIDEANYTLNDTIKGRKNFYFHSFEYRRVYDNKITNMENIEDVFSTFTIEYKKFKCQFYGKMEKIKNSSKKWIQFSWNGKNDSSISNTNICYYLKLLTPVRHRDFFTIISQNRGLVGEFCNDKFHIG